MTERRQCYEEDTIGVSTHWTAVRYQAVCTLVNSGDSDYPTYGLQCLGDWEGTWVQMDVIEDVSPNRDSVLHLANRFNHLQLSTLHFRDAVLDSVDT